MAGRYALLLSPGPSACLGQATAPDVEASRVKVCPHCAEELQDEATVCPQCHKNPAVRPAWATQGKSLNETGHWSDWREPAGAWEPNSVLDPLDDLPGPYESLEPHAAKERPIPWIVWAALVWTLFGGGIIIGLVLGIVARRQIKASDGRLGGLALANITIALNLVWLIFILVVIVPSFWKAMQTW
jgi:hypothetical protein